MEVIILPNSESGYKLNNVSKCFVQSLAQWLVCGLFIHSLNGVFLRAEVFNSNKQKPTVLFFLMDIILTFFEDSKAVSVNYLLSLSSIVTEPLDYNCVPGYL